MQRRDGASIAPLGKADVQSGWKRIPVVRSKSGSAWCTACSRMSAGTEWNSTCWKYTTKVEQHHSGDPQDPSREAGDD
jgi:hypothetical protein